LSRGGSLVTLEPGGQLELSGTPHLSARGALNETAAHMTEIHQVGEELGIRWLMMGRNPHTPLSALPRVPKERYRMMAAYLPSRGALALDMMMATASIQVSLDFADEADMARKLRVGLGLAPVAAALSANSPFAAGRPAGGVSARTLIWRATDPDRCGLPPGVFGQGYGYEDYTRWALDVPMFFIYREGRQVNTQAMTFRRFLADGFQGFQATLDDWALHLTTVFPEVRLKRYLEFRMMDAAPPAMLGAFAALWRGLMYHPPTLQKALGLTQGLTETSVAQALVEAGERGLAGRLNGTPLAEWARQVAALAGEGLAALAAEHPPLHDDRALLAPLEDLARRGVSRGEELLALFHGPWKEQLDPLFQREDSWG